MSSNQIEEHRDDWIAKTAANGVEYYYNIKTKKSQWEKPDTLKNPEERLNSTGWQEHVRADGKIFYHNPKLNQSTWKMPPEIKALKEKQAELRKQNASQGDQNLSGAGSKITVSLTTNMEFLDDDAGAEEIPHAEAVRIFMGLLRERVPPTMKWDQVHQLLHEEERYKLIKSIATKRKLYKEWVNQTKQHEKNEMRAKIEKAKDNFRQMLEDKQILTSDSKFHKVAHLFMNDYRWKSLEDKDRENIFQDYLDYLFDMEKQERRQKKKTLSEQIRKAFVEDTRITSETTWSQVNDLYRNDQRWNGLEDYDKLTIFCEHILDIDRKERDDKRRLRKLRERKNREAFRELLNEYTEKGKLTHKTKWRHFVEIIQDDSRLLTMLGQPGSTPREIFEDKVEFLKDQHKKLKEDLKTLLKDNQFSILSTNFEEFKKVASSNLEFSQLSESSKEFYFNYFIEKNKSKDKEIQKKKKKQTKKLGKFIKNIENLNKDSQYTEFEKLIEENQDFSHLSSDEKKNCFKEIIEQIAIGDESQISEKDGEKSKKKKSKKKKNKKKRDSNGESSNESRRDSKSRSRSKSHTRKSKKKYKERAEEDKDKEDKNKSDSKEKVASEEVNVPKALDFEKKPMLEEQNQIQIKPELPENQNNQVVAQIVTNEALVQNIVEEQNDPDQEEGEERNVLRVIKKKISKSSSRSGSEQKSKKKKEKKHSKKKSKKSDKKSKKKKKKRDSSSESSESEN